MSHTHVESVASKMSRTGFSLIESAVDEPHVERIEAILNRIVTSRSVRRRRGSVYAMRNLLVHGPPELRQTLNQPPLSSIAEAALGKDAKTVGAILFDKVPDANWKVPAHQDLAVPVKRRIDVDGFSGWSVKQGVPYVQPPLEVLDGLVALRVHLDDCPEENGALCVVPGTHRRRMTSRDYARFEPGDFVSCPARRGDVLCMKPLLVHKSGSSKTVNRRRVLHLLYANQPLPGDLEWN